jgi:uncharacterized protein YbjT (DUF2867 family)
VTDQPVAVVGAAGKTGRAVAAALAGRGALVRRLLRAGASARPGDDAVGVDLASGEGLHVALDGCAAVHLAAPNMFPDEPTLVDRVIQAACDTGVERIVYHSVAQPFVPSMPHHVAKAVGEDLVRRSTLSWTVLQPCAYTQNLLAGLSGDHPRLDLAYSPDAPFALVDLLDVAEVTAMVLTEPGHEGATYELGGPEVVTPEQVAEWAEDVLDREVPVNVQAPADWAASAEDLPLHVRKGLLAMFEHYDAHGLLAGSLVLRTLLGRPATTVRQVLARELH